MSVHACSKPSHALEIPSVLELSCAQPQQPPLVNQLTPPSLSLYLVPKSECGHQTVTSSFPWCLLASNFQLRREEQDEVWIVVRSYHSRFQQSKWKLGQKLDEKFVLPCLILKSLTLSGEMGIYRAFLLSQEASTKPLIFSLVYWLSPLKALPPSGFGNTHLHLGKIRLHLHQEARKLHSFSL